MRVLNYPANYKPQESRFWTSNVLRIFYGINFIYVAEVITEVLETPQKNINLV